MSCFEFVRIVRDRMGLAVLMICDADDQHSVMRGISSGAMFCLVKPLGLKDIENLWQFHKIKRRDLVQERGQQSMTVTPKLEPVAVALKQEWVGESYIWPAEQGAVIHEPRNSSQGHKKRKINEVGRASCWSPGESSSSSSSSSSSFTWTPEMLQRFYNAVRVLGFFDATSFEIVHHMNVPGLTTGIVTERLKQLYTHFLQKLRSLSQMANPDEASAAIQRLLSMVSPSTELDSANFRLSYANERSSFLACFLQNPHYRALLKTTIQGALVKWNGGDSGNDNNSLSSHPCGASELPADPLLVGLARAFERFIHASLSASYEPSVPMEVPVPWQQDQRVVQFQSPGPSVVLPPVPCQGGGYGISSAILDMVDADDMFDAIINLLN